VRDRIDGPQQVDPDFILHRRMKAHPTQRDETGDFTGAVGQAVLRPQQIEHIAARDWHEKRARQVQADIPRHPLAFLAEFPDLLLDQLYALPVLVEGAAQQGKQQLDCTMHLLELAAQLLEGGAGYQSAQGILGHAGLVDWQWRCIEGRGALQLDDTAAGVRGGRA